MKKRHYLTEEDLGKIRTLIQDEKLQQWKVAELIGVHVGTIEKVCRNLGLKTQRTGPRSGKDHKKKWKGGRVILKGGYVGIYMPDHPSIAQKKAIYVPEHRLVMEKKLGRYLLESEVVHHIDGNRLNNSEDNLIVFQTNGEHLKDELKGRIPNWSPAGYANMCQANPNWKTSLLMSKYGDNPQLLPNDHHQE